MSREDSRSSVASIDSQMRGLSTNESNKSQSTDGGASAKRWEPSDRVKAFTQEQVDEMRSRLNVTVEHKNVVVHIWQTAPIESLVDMVSM